MRYFLFFALMFFLGCNNNNKNTRTQNVSKIIQKSKKTNKENNLTFIKENNLSLTFKNKKLVYPNKKTVILFADSSFYSNEEKRILKKLKISFYETNNTFLRNYFDINVFPTIVILDKNKTVKYENFTPYEILKAEGF